MSESTIKILLDTDIGSDIDDAICLAYLLSQPRCNLLGITTVSGQAPKRAELASVLCRLADNKVPIYPGIESPLLTRQKQPEAAQFEAMGQWSRQTDFPRSEAIWFLKNTIRRHPGEIVLLAIGPLTNIALLFSIDPEIPSLLKGLVMMCGAFTAEQLAAKPLEWNAICDPYATAIVYSHSVRVHQSIGLDVTRRVTLEADEVKRRFRAPILRPVLDFAEVWFRKSNRITFHDPLAAVTLFDRDVCRLESGTVEVELAEEELLGMTHWKRVGCRHEVALDVEADGFFQEFFRVVGEA